MDAVAAIHPSEPETIQSLIEILEDAEISSWDVVDTLASYGTKALPAVPNLLTRLEDALNHEMDSLAEVIIDGLQDITGMDFGEDIVAWRDWWDEQVE